MQSSNTISCCLHHVQLCWRDAQILFVKYQKTFGVRCKDDGIAHANAYQLTELIHVFCFQEKHEAHNTCAHYSITENSKKVKTLLNFKKISTNSHCPTNRTFHDFDEQIIFSSQFEDAARIPPQKKRKGWIALGGSPSKEIYTNSHCPKKRTFHGFDEQIFFNNQFEDVANIPPQKKRKGELALGWSSSKEISTNSHCPKKRTFHEEIYLAINCSCNQHSSTEE